MADRVTERILIVDDQIGITGSPEQKAFLRAVRGTNSETEDNVDFELHFDEGIGCLERVVDRIRQGWVSPVLQRWALVLLDIRFPQDEYFGLKLLEALRNAHDMKDLPIVMLSSEDTKKSKRASKLSADGYLPKSDDSGKPLLTEQAFSGIVARCGLIGDTRNEEQLNATKSRRLEGRSLTHLRFLRDGRNLAIPQHDAVLCGESGVGKTQLAAYIHCWSGRQGFYVPWVATEVNAQIDAPHVFGQWAGAFTDAGNSYPGLLELANNGTFFLDEVANVPTSMQQAFLRLRDKGPDGKRRFFRIGSPEAKGSPRRSSGVERAGEISVDLLFLSGTNADLDQLAHQDKSFRSDLLYGLGHSLYCPSLNDRREDIPTLFRHLIEDAAESEKGTDGAQLEIEDEVFAWLKAQDWSQGNYRALGKVAQLAVRRLGRGFRTIDMQALPENVSDITDRRAKKKPPTFVQTTSVQETETSVLDPARADRGAFVAEHFIHLRRQAEMMAHALERTAKEPPSTATAPEYNYAGALKWLMNNRKGDTTTAKRLFGAVLDSIMRPTDYWAQFAGNDGFLELQRWLEEQPTLVAVRAQLQAKQVKERQRTGNESNMDR